jgi:hypothetical protein
MKLIPLNHGNHNNLWLKCKKWGITFKIVAFFDSGDAYVAKSTKKNFNPNRDYDALYEELKAAVSDMDFLLKTPKNKYLKHNFGTTQNVLNYISSK